MNDLELIVNKWKKSDNYEKKSRRELMFVLLLKNTINDNQIYLFSFDMRPSFVSNFKILEK